MTSRSHSAWFLRVASFGAPGGASLLALAFLLVALAAGPVRADSAIVQIPGASFVQQCPCTAGIGAATAQQGALTPDGPSTFYAALPYTGVKQVCSLTAFYRDVNAQESLKVGLYFRDAAVGAAIDAPATLMAEVESASGVPDTVRKVTTSNVSNRALKLGQRFYFLKVDFQNINMDLLGVQVKMNDSCG